MTTPTDPTAALKLARDALAFYAESAFDGYGRPIGSKAENAIAAIDAMPAPSAPAWPCHCDERGIGKPGVTCGDCPRDYGHTVVPSATAEQRQAGARAWMEASADPDMSPTDKVAHVYQAMRGAMPAPSAPTGGSPEHMLQDMDRGLSRWLSNQPGARLHAAEAAAAIAQATAPSGEPAAVCWGVEACINGVWSLQWPPRMTRVAAESDLLQYQAGTVLRIRPLTFADTAQAAPAPQAEPVPSLGALANAVIGAARRAMNDSFEAGGGDIAMPGHVAAALSLRLDEFDRAAAAPAVAAPVQPLTADADEAALYRWLRDTTHPDNLRKLFNGCQLPGAAEIRAAAGITATPAKG